MLGSRGVLYDETPHDRAASASTRVPTTFNDTTGPLKAAFMILLQFFADDPTLYPKPRIRSRMLSLSSLGLLVSVTLAQSNTNPQNATAFSLLYGYPLLAWQSYYAPILEEVGANTWRHSRTLNTAANRTVVKPNVDTLYSQFIYDLSQSNVKITIPDVPAYSFKLFSFYDPFGDNFANIGTGGFYQPGNYLITPYDRPGGSAVPGLQTTNSSSSSYGGTVSSPTPYGTLLVRWGVNATNVGTVHQWQDECSSQVLAPSPDISGPNMPRLESLITVYRASSTPADNVMNLLAHLSPPNAPAATLKAAGISNETYMSQSSVNLTLANATAVTMAAEAATDPGNIVPMNNDWTVLNPKLIGVYGTNYALRTVIAISGYLALRNPFAVYPTWSNASAGNANAVLTLGPNEALLLTFTGKPLLQEAGFWSLTAYGGDYFLIPNAMDVYALGDRSNITYPNGRRVYGGNIANDGSFQILLQPADVTPPANWTSNWLPAPASGGQVIPQLRFFVAEKGLIDGTYAYPKLERILVRSPEARGTSGGGGSATSTSGGSTASAGTGSPSPSSSAGSQDKRYVIESIVEIVDVLCILHISCNRSSIVLQTTESNPIHLRVILKRLKVTAFVVLPSSANIGERGLTTSSVAIGR